MFFFYKLPFKYFLGLGCHIGSRFHIWSVESSPNVLFKMLEYPVINLTSTSLNFISSINFIKFCTSRNLKPVFFFPKGFELYLNLQSRIWKFAYCLVHYWFPGFFSNFKFIFNKDKFKAVPPHFLHIRRYPDFLIFLGISERTQHLASTDARVSRMPSIGLNDVDIGPALFNYSIFSNSKSFVLAFHFYKLFLSAVVDGAKFFTGRIANKLFKFYYKTLIRSLSKTYIDRKLVYKSSRDQVIKDRKKSLLKKIGGSVYRYPQRRTGHFKWNNYTRLLKFFEFFRTRGFSPWKSNLFLAHFSYSTLFRFSKKSKKLEKLVFSKKTLVFKTVSIEFKKFFRFKKLINFFKKKLDMSFSSYSKKFRFFDRIFSIRTRRVRAKRLPFPRSVLVVKKKRVKFKKYNKYGKYSPEFLRFKLKTGKFYNGSNVFAQPKNVVDKYTNRKSFFYKNRVNKNSKPSVSRNSPNKKQGFVPFKKKSNNKARGFKNLCNLL